MNRQKTATDTEYHRRFIQTSWRARYSRRTLI